MFLQKRTKSMRFINQWSSQSLQSLTELHPLKKIPVIIKKAVYTAQLISYLHHIYTLLVIMKQSVNVQNSFYKL